MAFCEHLTLCPRCHMLIAIDLIMVSECAMVRVDGDCANPACRAQYICFDIDLFQSSLESVSSRATPHCRAQSKL